MDVQGGVTEMRTTMRRASRLLRAMANERRLLILCHLLDGEKSVGELQKLIAISQSALSQHLARLRAEELVTTRREAQNIYYSVAEPAVAEVFRHHRWPGNVRELENLLERIFVLEDDNQVLVKHIPPRIMREVEEGPSAGAAAPSDLEDLAGLSFQDATAAFQTRLIEAALERHTGDLQAVAEALGMSRHALRHHMIKLGLR